jgi:hypothetical protein
MAASGNEKMTVAAVQEHLVIKEMWWQLVVAVV